MVVLYAYQKPNILVERDKEVISSSYELLDNLFHYKRKIGTITALLKDLLRMFSWSKKGVDRVVVRFAGYHGIVPLLFARLKKIPAIVIVGGTDAARLPSINYGNYRAKVFGFITNLNYKLAGNIMVVHESLHRQDYTYDSSVPEKQGVSAFFKGKLRVHVVYNGYDAAIYKPNPQLIRKPKSFVTAAGDLSREVMIRRKGIDLILEVAKMRPEWQFSLIGGKKIPEKFLPLPKNVLLRGFMGQKELINTFSEHQFYLQVSMFEGFPNALCEAMLCECIPIGSSVSGVPFIIDNTGYILQNRSAKQLTELIDNALADDSLAEKQKLARKRIADNFTWEKRVQNFKAVIHSL